MNKLTHQQLAERIARDIPEGAYVNLGIGLPTRIANYLPADREIFLHSENGILGMGPAPEPGCEDPELINAGKQPVTLSFAGDLPVKAKLLEGQMSMDFNIMTRRDRCRAKVRVADRTFTTFASRGGVVFVLSGAWQLGEKLLTADQGAWWHEGNHTLRLLKAEGTLLFSEIFWLPGH